MNDLITAKAEIKELRQLIKAITETRETSTAMAHLLYTCKDLVTKWASESNNTSTKNIWVPGKDE